MTTLEQRYIAPLSNPDNSANEQEIYCKELETLTDQKLFDECESKIWLSALVGNNPKSCYHWHATACYDECARRAKPEIYERAYKKVEREN